MRVNDSTPVEIILEKIPCWDAKRRVWQALDLLRQQPSPKAANHHPARAQTAGDQKQRVLTPKTGTEK